MSAGTEDVQQQEKRGRKRSLAEVESEVSEPPSPKRRKLSNGNSEHVAIPQDGERIKEKMDPAIVSSSCHDANGTTDPKSQIMPNAIPHDTASRIIDLVDSDSPTTTNDSATCNSHHNQREEVIPNGSKESMASNSKSNHDHVDRPQMTDLTSVSNKESTANNPETDIEMEDRDRTDQTASDPNPLQNDPPKTVPSQSSINNSNSNSNSNTNSNNPNDHSSSTVQIIPSSIIRPYNDGNSQFDYLSIWTDERCLLHAIPVDGLDDDFNERPARLRALHQMIDDEQWHKSCRVTSRLEEVPTIGDIQGLHGAGYLTDLKNCCSRIGEGKWNTATGSDTYLVRRTFDAALVSAGLVIEATKHTFCHVPPLPFSPSMSVDLKTKSRVEKQERDSSSQPMDTAHRNGHSEREQMDIDDTATKTEAVDNEKRERDLSHVENGSVDARSQQKGDPKPAPDAPEGASKPLNCDKSDAADPISNGEDSTNLKTPPLCKQSTEMIEDSGTEREEANDEATKYKDQHPKKYAVVLNRPPGHHCDGTKYSGYCFINSTAVAIEKQLNMDTKVLVLDIDVHHGDGTQKIFYSEPSVLTVSLHQYDGHFFPSSGTRTEYGSSKRHPAYGTNINIPLGKRASDLDVLYALRNMVWHIVEKFEPDIAFYAVGTDGVANDKANNSTIFTPSLYGQVAYELKKYVNLIVVTTEGGYTTEYLARGMSCVLHGLTDQIDPHHYPTEFAKNDILDTTVHTVAASKSDLRRVWDFEQDPDEIKKIFNHAKRLDATPSFDEMIESMYIPGQDDEGSAGDYDHEMDEFDDDDFVVSDHGKRDNAKKKKSSTKNPKSSKNTKNPKKEKKKKNSKKRSLKKGKEDDPERKRRKMERREREKLKYPNETKEERKQRKQERKERKRKRRESRERRRLERSQKRLAASSDGERRDSAIDLTGDSEHSVYSKNGETSVDEEGSLRDSSKKKKRKHHRKKKDKSKRKKQKSDKEKSKRKRVQNQKQEKKEKANGSNRSHSNGGNTNGHSNPMSMGVVDAVQQLVDNLNRPHLCGSNGHNGHFIVTNTQQHHHQNQHHQNGHSVPALIPAPSNLNAIPIPTASIPKEVEVIDLIEDSPTTHTSNDGQEDTEKKQDIVVPQNGGEDAEMQMVEQKQSESKNLNSKRRRRPRRGRSKSKTNSPEANGVVMASMDKDKDCKKDSEENSCDINNLPMQSTCLSAVIGDGINTLAIDQKQDEKDERDEKGNPSDSDDTGGGAGNTAASGVIVIDSE